MTKPKRLFRHRRVTSWSVDRYISRYIRQWKIEPAVRNKRGKIVKPARRYHPSRREALQSAIAAIWKTIGRAA